MARKKPGTIIREANELAASFYRHMGYAVPEGYRFDRARHPTERMCWDMTVTAYLDLKATELRDVLIEAEEDES